ncbi:MAG TPA: TetR family transcriptional regulator [Metalysinibacillus jejuensis]|uniref:TetR family transcriptional regulator n=1 Tax=Metalysinibacillus jejuensis TaxID=914327 RepID=A0A921NE11_9BACL|nr:TetR family transcriptional regulator [Metalysinibacillus jejuensis]HJH11948.1 TetR family transcriptional regulator [Metalysinibacillus jejuensis]
MSKKDGIVQAAIEAFKENGVHKATISDIVRRAGIAQGTFYLYFPSKWSLMPAIAEVMVHKTLDVVNQTVDEQATAEVQLQQIIKAIFEVARNYHDIQALIYAGLAATEHLKEWETVYAPIYEWLQSWLMNAQAAGFVRSTVQPEAVSKLMIGVIESAAEQIYLYDSDAQQHAKAQQQQVFELLYHALKK